jgi:ABC-type microcin C transport system permease subunit YejE
MYENNLFDYLLIMIAQSLFDYFSSLENQAYLFQQWIILANLKSIIESASVKTAHFRYIEKSKYYLLSNRVYRNVHLLPNKCCLLLSLLFSSFCFSLDCQ